MVVVYFFQLGLAWAVDDDVKGDDDALPLRVGGKKEEVCLGGEGDDEEPERNWWLREDDPKSV